MEDVAEPTDEVRCVIIASAVEIERAVDRIFQKVLDSFLIMAVLDHQLLASGI